MLHIVLNHYGYTNGTSILKIYSMHTTVFNLDSCRKDWQGRLTLKFYIKY